MDGALQDGPGWTTLTGWTKASELTSLNSFSWEGTSDVGKFSEVGVEAGLGECAMTGSFSGDRMGLAS